MNKRIREKRNTAITRSGIRKRCTSAGMIRRQLVFALCMIGMVNLWGCTLYHDPAEKEESWSFRSSGEKEYAADAGDGTSEHISGDGNTEEDTDIQTARNGPEHETEEEAVFGYVYLCGAVSAPGVYPIQDGMRVFEVIALAGGLTGDADTEWVNQAETVADGEQIRIYTREETAQMREQGITPGRDAAGNAASGTAAESTEKTERKININTADREQLMTLSGIGEAKADAILKYREAHGGFSSIEEICQIPGIKEAVFSNIKDRISIQD